MFEQHTAIQHRSQAFKSSEIASQAKLLML